MEEETERVTLQIEGAGDSKSPSRSPGPGAGTSGPKSQLAAVWEGPKTTKGSKTQSVRVTE